MVAVVFYTHWVPSGTKWDARGLRAASVLNLFAPERLLDRFNTACSSHVLEYEPLLMLDLELPEKSDVLVPKTPGTVVLFLIFNVVYHDADL